MAKIFDIEISETQQTWWVVYLQDFRRPVTNKLCVGSGARYALQTFFGSERMVKHQFGKSLGQIFSKRQEALDYLKEMNIVDSVMNS